MLQNLPLRFPLLLLKAFVYGLCDGGLHKVHISDHLRCEHVTQVVVELATTQVLYNVADLVG